MAEPALEPTPIRQSDADLDGEVCELALLGGSPGPYSYLVPAEFTGRLSVGMRVLAPLGTRGQVEGVVLRIVPRREAVLPADVQLRPIELPIAGPGLPRELLKLVRFIADYYLAPIGEALRLCLPAHEQVEKKTVVRLSAEGTAMATQLKGPLLPPAVLRLSVLERTLLESLHAAALRGRGLSLERLLQKARETIAELPPSKKSAKRKPLKRTQLEQQLRRLIGQGLVELTEQVAGEKATGPKVERWVRANEKPLKLDEERLISRSEVRASLYRQIVRFGPLPLSALRELSPQAGAVVKRLSEAGLLHIEERTLSNEHQDGSNMAPVGYAPAKPPPLTPEQQAALSVMLDGLRKSLAEAGREAGYHGYLLHGVTGSGKTELYLQLIAEALAAGKSALVLVPEIALTPQLSARFVARFGPQVAVLHSGLTESARAASWRRILNGEVRIALGPRSALFAPLRDLAIIVVDEEHDSSFKQEDRVRYHGRDVALYRAKTEGAVAVLGSATPSLEALMLSQNGKLIPLTLTQRATGQPLPRVEIIDLKQHMLGSGKERSALSAPLARAIEETLAAGEQALLFLNRRGYETSLLCTACGHRLECRHCAVTLTFHKARARLTCHYCDYSEPVPERCPVCAATALIHLGLGTEKLAEQVTERFPSARIARLDRDTTQDLGPVLQAMHRRELDILIGTQMLAKGHDFPGVTLVGVVLADTGMGLPDFRASERTFQLLSQVAGRAGRADRPGRVLIQTYNPEHPAVDCAARHDYAGFAETELVGRRELGYPPTTRVGLLRIDGADPLLVRAAAQRLSDELRGRLHGDGNSDVLTVLGPAEAPLSRLKGRTRWQLIFRAVSPKALRGLLVLARELFLASDHGPGLRLSLDVDPVSLL